MCRASATDPTACAATRLCLNVWDVAVKHEAASRGGGTWLCALKPGDPVEASMPRCTFPIATGAAAHVMVAGGIGVTPFLAMAHELERRGAEWSLHVLYRGEPPCPGELAQWRGAGHVTLHDTARHMRPGWDQLLGQPGEGRHAYCCGPTPMLEAFERATVAWPPGTVHVEYFVPPPAIPSADAKSYTVRRAATGAEIAVPAGGSLLAALRALVATVDASCEGGICGACEVAWSEGEPIHRDRVLSPERRRTHLMACVAQCASARLTVDV